MNLPRLIFSILLSLYDKSLQSGTSNVHLFNLIVEFLDLPSQNDFQPTNQCRLIAMKVRMC